MKTLGCPRPLSGAFFCYNTFFVRAIRGIETSSRTKIRMVDKNTDNLPSENCVFAAKKLLLYKNSVLQMGNNGLSRGLGLVVGMSRPSRRDVLPESSRCLGESTAVRI